MYFGRTIRRVYGVVNSDHVARMLVYEMMMPQGRGGPHDELVPFWVGRFKGLLLLYVLGAFR